MRFHRGRFLFRKWFEEVAFCSEDAFKWMVSTAERHFTYTRGQYERQRYLREGWSREDDIDTEGSGEEDSFNTEDGNQEDGFDTEGGSEIGRFRHGRRWWRARWRVVRF